jgi:hypothetical protein
MYRCVCTFPGYPAGRECQIMAQCAVPCQLCDKAAQAATSVAGTLQSMYGELSCQQQLQLVMQTCTSSQAQQLDTTIHWRWRPGHCLSQELQMRRRHLTKHTAYRGLVTLSVSITCDSYCCSAFSTTDMSFRGDPRHMLAHPWIDPMGPMAHFTAVPRMHSIDPLQWPARAS